MPQQVRAAQQSRSQKIMNRIVEAAEQLLREHANPEFAIREICLRAGASQSSFYSRFPEKPVLLHHLVERLTQRGFAALDSLRPQDSNELRARLLSDASPEVRAEAAHVLSLGDARDAVPLLTQAASDASPRVLTRVLDSLGFLSDPDGLEVASGLLGHPNLAVRQAAEHAHVLLEYSDGF